MINLDIFKEDVETKPYQEGIISDSLSKTSGVDVDDIKADLKDDNKSFTDKLDSVNTKGIGKVRDQADAIDRVLGKTTVDTRSIVARARNSVIQFPIYVPQTIRVNQVHIIAGMFERVYTTLVQTVLSQNPIMDEEEANNLVFLKKFHSNIKEAADVLVNKYYEPIDDIDHMMCESVFFEQKLTENCTVRFSVVPCNDNDIIMENARLVNEPLSGLNYLQEKKYVTSTDVSDESNATYINLSEEDLKEIAKDRGDFTDEELNLLKKSADEIRKEEEAAHGGRKGRDKSGATDPSDDKIDKEIQKKIAEKRAAEKKLRDELADLKDHIKKKDDPSLSKYEYDGGRYRQYTKSRKITKRTTPAKETSVEPGVRAPEILRESDIKKQNDLLPYTIKAQFQLRTRNGLDRKVEYIIGIKSVLHLFRTQDLAEDLRELITGNIKSLQKIRYKTGEINFKDYFFNIKQLKSDAAKHINYDKRWINTLKRLAEYKRLHGSMLKNSVKALTGGSVPIPNGTLVLTQPDVTTLTNQTGIDLSVVSNAKRLAKNLFLIAVVIVDSTDGTMRVLFPDMSSEWDIQSLAAIDAELSKTDNSKLMRELNHMVNK